MAKKKQALMEKRKWYKNTKALIALVTAVVAGIVAVVQLLKLLGVDMTGAPPTQHLVIVLDASEAMNTPFAGSTKFNVAKQVLGVKLDKGVLDTDNLALRLFGGDCSTVSDKKSTWPEVSFGRDNKKKVVDALEKIKPQGETTLVSAVIAAFGDLVNVSHRTEEVSKKLILIAGRFDSCPFTTVDDIKERLQENDPEGKVKVDIQFVGMGVPAEDREKFRLISQKTGGKALFADNQKELELALTKPDLANEFAIAKVAYLNEQFSQALPVLEKAAEENVAEAMTLLGNMYYHGKGVPKKDYAEAARQYRRAADLGDTKAMIHLGNMYLYGQGVPREDDAEAFTLFKNSAESGDPEGMAHLAWMYSEGRGVAKNLAQADFWNDKAAAAKQPSSEAIGQK